MLRNAGESALAAQLAEIEQALDSGSYRAGTWEEFLVAAHTAPPAERARLETAVTRVSDRLHGRRAPRVLSPERGLALEALAACGGFSLLGAGAASESRLLLLAAAAVLATALQPLLKTSTGLALGLPYSYAYLLKGEPRFKLQFGAYLAAPVWKRVLLHGTGTLGSPLACLVVAGVARGSSPGLALVLLCLALAHLAFQALLALLAFAGRRRVPLLGLLRLTSAGAAGWELRLARQAARTS